MTHRPTRDERGRLGDLAAQHPGVLAVTHATRRAAPAPTRPPLRALLAALRRALAARARPPMPADARTPAEPRTTS